MNCGTMWSLKGPIQSVEVTYLLHATEDPKKLVAAVSALLAVEAEPEEDEMEGHFGNKITRVGYHLTGEDAGAAFSAIASRISAPLKKELKGRIAELIDEHSALFLRFDKQRLVSGSLEEGAGDPVKVKVKPRVFVLKGGAKEFYSQLLFGGT